MNVLDFDEEPKLEVFVDEPIWSFGRMVMCHMLSYSLSDLHTMASKLGLRRKWFQNKPGGTPHYDICKSKRKEALDYGAKEISRKEVGAIIKYWRDKSRNT